MTRRLAIGLLALLLTGYVVPARADLVVYIQDTTVAAGGTATLDVYIGSTSPAADAFFAYQVQLDSGAPSAGQLGFTIDGGTAWLNQPPYLFNGDSYDWQNLSSSPPVSYLPGTISGPALSILIGDSTASGMSYAPPDNVPGDTLLGQVQIFAGNYGAATYQVTLDTGVNTAFGTADSVNVVQGYATGFMGTITVLPASVPEPGSIVSGMTALILIAGFRRVRRGICRRG